MSTTTTNYGFVKPALTDAPPDITVMNPNWDEVDTELKKSNDHIANKSNPHSVTKSQVGLGNVDNTADSAKPVSTAQATAIADAKKAGTDAQANLDTHTANKSNPHGVTKSQVGLGSVPNVSTNNQTPTYTQASTLANLTSGEKLSVSMGKIMKAIADLISHIGNKSNPHGVTAAQAGAVDKTGDVMSGSLTVIDNFNVNKTFDDVEYKTYARPINYSIGNNGDYSTGIIHYKGGTNDSQLMFNKDGVMLRDNVNAKAYQIFGQHNAALLKSFLLPLDGSSAMTGPLLMEGNRINMSPDANWSSGAYNSINHGTDGLTLTTRYDGANRNFVVKNTSVALQNAIQFWDTPKNRSYSMFGENNKPTGSYTGNGSSTQRTIQVPNILESRGLLLYAYKNNNAYASALVLQTGAILINSTGTVSGVPFAQARWSYGSGTGNLVLATTNACLNENGITYHYQVL